MTTDRQFSDGVRAAFAGRRIAIPAPSYQYLAPSGEIDHGRRERALDVLEALGAVPVLMDGALEREGRFAGPDERRAEDLMTAAELPGVDLVMPIRGGYGMTRLLPLLDWERLAEARTPFVGYSDFTAFNAALYARTGRASWQGPMLGSFEEPDPFMLERFTAVFGRALEPLAFAEPEWASDWKREAGEAEGVLWGGNLALLASLAGTPWMPDVRGGILYLEDVGEAAYRVERMLLTLLDAGILGRQRAVVLGDFSGAAAVERSPGEETLPRVFGYLRRRLPAGTLMALGLPFGHVARKAALPFGREGRPILGAEGARLSWSAR